MNPVEIVYDDAHICVACKPQGIDSEHSLINTLSKQLGCYIYPVHRLDKDAGGLILLAKTKQSASKLSDSIQRGELEKQYLAVVIGSPINSTDTFEDYLYHDRQRNKSYAVKSSRKGVKLARLEYVSVGSCAFDGTAISLVKIRLFTGRTHQIRVQFASRGFPLLGDVKYGGKKDGIKLSLWSYLIGFRHPTNGQMLEFKLLPSDQFPWNAFNTNLRLK